jgi:hypothetical protein
VESAVYGEVMDREGGFYWISLLGGSDWQVAEWDGDDWWLVGCEDKWAETDLHKIDEHRINPPN